MKQIICCIALSLATLPLFAQFSLGGDLIGIGLTHVQQHEIGLMPDSLLSDSRVVFSVNSNVVGSYQYKRWEFSLGLGHKNYRWKQKFRAPTEDVKIFVGSNSQSDSSDYLAKVTYKTKLIILPVGVKYLLGRQKDSWINAFVSAQLIPSFVYQQSTTPGYFDQGVFILVPVRVKVEEDPALVETTKAYFQPKTNTFLLDGKAELGLRIWGIKHKFCADLSFGMLHGFTPLHQQMGLNNGFFSNLALRFFFKSNPSGDGLM